MDMNALRAKEQQRREQSAATGGGPAGSANKAATQAEADEDPDRLFSYPPVSPTIGLLLRYVNQIGFLCVLFIPQLIPGLSSQGAVSSANPTPITPPSWAFGIWGLIYLMQMVFLAYQSLPYVNQGLVFRRISFWYLGVCLCSIVWSIVWGMRQIIPSSVIIWVFFFCLAAVYFRLHYDKHLSAADIRAKRTWAEYCCVYVPFSLYTSWMMGASIINTFQAVGRPAAELAVPGVVALMIGAVINVGVLAWTRDVWIPLVNVWTLAAIASNPPAPGLQIVHTNAANLALAESVCILVAFFLNAREFLSRQKIAMTFHPQPRGRTTGRQPATTTV